ncbi:MAG TPA: thiamine-phosphate kinase [Desulfobacteraceae bacterium]|nr:thiamine-phosphate kinase [Desulfobacteraceae bacterium]
MDDRKVKDLGEIELVDEIKRYIDENSKLNPHIILGIGDDAASVSIPEGYEMLITCDSMVEGVHFLKDSLSSYEMGRRAANINISDIGAMGGVPMASLVSLGLYGDIKVGEIIEIYRGLLEELRPFNATIIGGNITSVYENILIDITLFGIAKKGNIVKRSTAHVDDVILISGYPGESAAGLWLLKQGKTTDHPLVNRYKLAQHRAREAHAISREHLVSSMIDISDGLLLDLYRICKSSKVGAEIFKRNIPISSHIREISDEMGEDPLRFILGKSDDYELIITCPEANRGRIEEIFKHYSIPVHHIGQITEKACEISMVDENGEKHRLEPEGWNHFTAYN